MRCLAYVMPKNVRVPMVIRGAQTWKFRRERNHSQNTTETVEKQNTHSICLRFSATATETSSMLCCCPSVYVRAFIYFVSFCVYQYVPVGFKREKDLQTSTHVHTFYIHTKLWVKSLKRDKHNPRTISKGPIQLKNLIFYCVQSIEHAEHLWRSSVSVLHIQHTGYFYAARVVAAQRSTETNFFSF